MNNPGMTVIR